MKKILFLVSVAVLLISSCKKTDKTVSVDSVSISPGSLTMTEGETQTLTASVKPAEATHPEVTWSSSDAQVVTVNAGKVTAVKPGSATVTATADGKKGNCSITVVARVYSVTGVTLDITNKELSEGENFTLKATVAPENASNKTVSWSSSAPDVASVDQNGKVTAIKPGTATITVTTTDGGKTATCEVTVIARVYSVTGVTLDTTNKELSEGEYFTLKATVAPENASDKTVSWSSSAPDVASVDQNGKVTAIKAGTATITVTTTDGGKTATCEVTVIARVASVSLNKDQITLTEGQSETLTATVLPERAHDKSVRWESSASDVASVDQNGKVTAIKAGTATITVTTTDGGKTATCQITVQAATGGTEGYGNGNDYGEGQF